MKTREEVQAIISSSPALRAFRREPPRAISRTSGRICGVVLLLSGAVCILLTGQVYRALPYILGIGMVLIGVNCTVCGLWTGEYRNKETKLTAKGIVYIALGLVILHHRANADAVIGSIWGVLGLMKGSEALNEALYRLSRKESFAALAIQAVIEVVLGFLLLTDPSSAVRHHVLLLGLELLAVGWQALREAN